MKIKDGAKVVAEDIMIHVENEAKEKEGGDIGGRRWNVAERICFPQRCCSYDFYHKLQSIGRGNNVKILEGVFCKRKFKKRKQCLEGNPRT